MELHLEALDYLNFGLESEYGLRSDGLQVGQYCPGFASNLSGSNSFEDLENGITHAGY